MNRFAAAHRAAPGSDRPGRQFSNLVGKYRLRKSLVAVMPSRLPLRALAPASAGKLELA